MSEPEREIVEAHSRPNAALIHETIRAEGESELGRSVSALLLSGLAAGLAMGLSLIAEGLLRAHLPEAPWRELVSKIGYAVGFLVVVLGRQQLFTENTLTPVLPLLYNRECRTFGRVARLWALVLAANVAGTWAVSAVLAGTDLFPPEIKEAFSAISQHAVEARFGSTVLKGICCGLADRAAGMADARIRGGTVRRDRASHLAGVGGGICPRRCRLGRCEFPCSLESGERRRLPLALLHANTARQRNWRCHPGRCPKLWTGSKRSAGAPLILAKSCRDHPG